MAGTLGAVVAGGSVTAAAGDSGDTAGDTPGDPGDTAGDDGEAGDTAGVDVAGVAAAGRRPRRWVRMGLRKGYEVLNP